MSGTLSVTEMIAELEAQIEHYSRAEATHAEQAVFHSVQRKICAEELVKLRERHAAFKEAATAAVELVGRVPELTLRAEVSKAEEEDAALSPYPVSRLIARVVDQRAPGDPFGATAITYEVNRRWTGKLKRQVDVRTVGACLRRLHQRGRLSLVQAGRAFHESLYARPGAGPN